jgi:hypothetical protein
VLDAIDGVLSSLYTQLPRLERPDDHSAVLGAIVALAVKQGSLLHILEAVRLLLAYDEAWAAGGGGGMGGLCI